MRSSTGSPRPRSCRPLMMDGIGTQTSLPGNGVMPIFPSGVILK